MCNTNLTRAQFNDLTNETFEFDDWPLANFTSLPAREIYNDVRNACYNVIIPIILTVGIVGNTLNICVYSAKRLRRSLEDVELCATTGLLILAVSDLLFCVSGAALLVFSEKSRGDDSGHDSVYAIATFYYNTYKGALINCFMFSSTWVIVTTAVERYIAICHPFKARGIIKLKWTLLVHGTVLTVAVILNIPQFLKYSVRTTPCFPNCQDMCYFREMSALFLNIHFSQAYRYIWYSLGVFLPVAILAYSNVQLVLELQRARKRSLVGHQDPIAISALTAILVAMIFLFILLVFPSMILDFLQPMAINLSTASFFRFQTALELCNVMQAVKFACNFALYCLMNKRFREHLQIGEKCKLKTPPEQSTSTSSNRYHLVEIS